MNSFGKLYLSFVGAHEAKRVCLGEGFGFTSWWRIWPQITRCNHTKFEQIIHTRVIFLAAEIYKKNTLKNIYINRVKMCKATSKLSHSLQNYSFCSRWLCAFVNLNLLLAWSWQSWGSLLSMTPTFPCCPSGCGSRNLLWGPSMRSLTHLHFCSQITSTRAYLNQRSVDSHTWEWQLPW